MNFINSRTRTAQPLTLDAIRQMAPSAMAEHKHDSRTDRYTYVPTVAIIEGMQRAGFQPFEAKQCRTRQLDRKEFTKHMIRFRHESAMGLQVVNDSVPEVVLVNSHDGSSAYRLMAGIFRLICSNGMIIADSLQASVSVPHKGNIIGQVIDASNGIVRQSHRTLEVVKDWQALQLTAGEQGAFAEAAHTIRFADSDGQVNTPITPAQLLGARRHDDQGSDLWRTMNRVQENVIRGGLTATTRTARRRRVSTRGVNGIDQDVKLNTALWKLAERMAELKQQAA